MGALLSNIALVEDIKHGAWFHKNAFIRESSLDIIIERYFLAPHIENREIHVQDTRVLATI